MLNTAALTEEEMSQRLQASLSGKTYDHYPDGFFARPARPAAILIPLLKDKNEWHVLFIRRTVVPGDMHSGQVAFPGGRRDDGDTSIEAAALRETQEELGIEPKDVRILGRLDDFITISNYRVTPLIGVILWPYALRLAEGEVDRAFTIPLDWLMNPGNREVRRRELPDGREAEVIYFKPYDEELLWGASARFMLRFLEILDQPPA